MFAFKDPKSGRISGGLKIATHPHPAQAVPPRCHTSGNYIQQTLSFHSSEVWDFPNQSTNKPMSAGASFCLVDSCVPFASSHTREESWLSNLFLEALIIFTRAHPLCSINFPKAFLPNNITLLCSSGLDAKALNARRGGSPECVKL